MKIRVSAWLTGSFLTLSLLLTYNTVTVTAGSPWRWSLVLKQNVPKDAMIMPTAMYVDAEKGHYYVVDSGRNRLLSFDRRGELLHIFNAGKALDIPYDIIRTGRGGIWVVEKGKNSLSYIDLKARKVVPHTLRYQGRLIYPDRIEPLEDNILVLDKATGNIIEYSADLIPRRLFSCDNCPWGFVDFKIHDGKLWALDQRNKTIQRFNLDGQIEQVLELGNDVNFPVSLAVGPSGYIYVLDRHRRDIAVYDRDGSFKYRFLRGGIAQGQLYYPIELRFDPWGGLCVVDEGNARVEVFRR